MALPGPTGGPAVALPGCQPLPPSPAVSSNEALAVSAPYVTSTTYTPLDLNSEPRGNEVEKLPPASTVRCSTRSLLLLGASTWSATTSPCKMVPTQPEITIVSPITY